MSAQNEKVIKNIAIFIYLQKEKGLPIRNGLIIEIGTLLDLNYIKAFKNFT